MHHLFGTTKSEYKDGRCKVFFAQSFYKKQEDNSGERCLSVDAEAWYKIEQNMLQKEQVVEDIKHGRDSKLDLELSGNIPLRINPTYSFINIRKFWCRQIVRIRYPQPAEFA